MNDLKMSLRKVARELTKAAKEVEKLAGKLEAQTKTSTAPKKKAAGKNPLKQTVSAKQPTAADTVYKVIASLKKGANIATLKQKTGYDNKKIHNLVYKLKKQDKIKSETKGVYVKV
jgi:predicted Rossmann fold nucleotide-binding protein DprA/Smf involved in DNA uptake